MGGGILPVFKYTYTTDANCIENLLEGNQEINQILI